MSEMFLNVPMMLVLTVGAYLLGVYVKTKAKTSLLHPFLIAIPTIIAILYFADIPCDFYIESNNIINFLLGPSVVAFGLLLYDHYETIKKNALSMLVSVSVGSVVGVCSVYILCRLFSLDEIFFYSLEAKSVTTPIAIDLTSPLGGNAALTAVSVIFTGIFGAMFGSRLMRIFGKHNPISRGLAFGCAAHGIGTARALEQGAVEGAVSGLAIALMGLMTAVVVPVFNMIIS